jgi:hypothetical protein
MKIKICISNYGVSQLDHLHTVIAEFKKYKKYEVDIKVFTTVPVEENHILYPESITTSLPFMCREEMVNDINNYDLFIYNENDHLITENNIDCFLEVSKDLKPNQVCGFIQYEEIYGAKILVHNPYYGTLIGKKYDNLFTCTNNHQGCWILLKKDLIEVVKSGNFLVDPHYGTYGMLEQGASDPYTSCGMEKVFPLDLLSLERLMIKHLPVKYCIKDEFINHAIKIDQFYTDAVSHNN